MFRDYLQKYQDGDHGGNYRDVSSEFELCITSALESVVPV